MTNYIFSEKEIKCKTNYKKVKKTERSILQNRFNYKIKSFNSKKLVRDLSFIPIKKRAEIIEGVVKGLPVGYVNALSHTLKNESSKNIKDIQKITKKLNKDYTGEITSEEAFSDVKDWQSRKLVNDYFYISRTKEREELFREILTRGIEKVKATNSKRTIIILRELFERGIILEESAGVEEFEKRCRKILESNNVAREGWLNYRVYPFKARPNFLKSTLRLNPVYASDRFVKFSFENFKDFGIFHERIH